MKKQIWEIGGMNSVPPLKIATLEEDELYLVFEILEDGELGFEIPLIDDNDLHIYNRISYSKDKKTWIHTDINEYIPVKKGEIWYCKGECSSIGDYPIGLFIGINGLDKIKYNVSGNISAILDIRKENPDVEKIMIEMVEGLDKELLKLQSPEEALISIFGEEAAFIVIEAIKYSDKNKTPAHFRNLLISAGVPDVPGLSDEEFIKLFILEETGGNLGLESLSCVALCLLVGNEFGSLELPPKLDSLFQSENVVDASGLVIDYSTTCNRMFASCHNLIKAPKLPMTTLVNECYYYMFHGCTSLTIAPELPAISLTDGCYSDMFAHCTSLTTAPKLPAMTLTSQCYYHMFDHCNKLNNITMLATNISAYNCLNGWVSDVASNGTFIKHPDMTTLPSGVSGIPEGWTVEDAIV